MGLVDRAHEALDFFFESQRPAAWNHWGEIVWRNRNTPKFIGDLPHTWVGSDFIRSIRSFFVFEREADEALVLAAGLNEDWITHENGVILKRLPTYYGTLNFSVMGDDSEVQLKLSGDITIPKGGIVIYSRRSSSLKKVTVNGSEIASFTDNQANVREFPAEIMFYY